MNDSSKNHRSGYKDFQHDGMDVRELIKQEVTLHPLEPWKSKYFYFVVPLWMQNLIAAFYGDSGLYERNISAWHL